MIYNWHLLKRVYFIRGKNCMQNLPIKQSNEKIFFFFLLCKCLFDKDSPTPLLRGYSEFRPKIMYYNIHGIRILVDPEGRSAVLLAMYSPIGIDGFIRPHRYLWYVHRHRHPWSGSQVLVGTFWPVLPRYSDQWPPGTRTPRLRQLLGYVLLYQNRHATY